MGASLIKTGWWSFDLPGYRKQPEAATYSLFDYESLPPIQQNLDENFHWLKSEPIKQPSLAEGTYPDGSEPDLSKLSKIIAQIDIELPQAFTTFINSKELHHRIRSCTDCYLDVADRAVRAVGDHDGFLVHFLSDSQWCLHWYIHIDYSSQHFVLVSPNAYGFTFEATGEEIDEDAPHQKDEIELEQEDILLCAPTFTEFIYRFWLENEIRFALAWDKQPLTATQQAYVNHYIDLARG
jgi:hypothetical protein